jgi:hypothetical protein
MKISPDMRAAIDAAVAAGRVTVVPPIEPKAAAARSVRGRSGLTLVHNGLDQAQTVPPVYSGRGRPPKGVTAPGGTLDQKKAIRAKSAVARVADMRRFKTTAVPTGEPGKVAPYDATGTLFPSRVALPGPGDQVLKDGRNNSKIGGVVLKGRLRGAPIYTLTLEERATCPRSCAVWRTCYGNGMQYAIRWQAGPELCASLAAEVAELCREHRQVLIRLHVLGDFPTVGYVHFWGVLLAAHPGLHVFGFTAWHQGTPIGDAVAALRRDEPGRFMIRHSGRDGPWGSFVVDFPLAESRIGEAIVCPEQADAMNGKPGRHCGNCALCWHSDTAIAFAGH